MIDKFISSLGVFGKKTSVTQTAGSPAIKRLISQQQKVHFAYLAALVFGLANFGLCIKVLISKDVEPKILVIDGAQTVHIGPLKRLTESREFIASLGTLVNQVIFDRNPNGLGMPEFATHLFTKKALAQLKLDVDAQKPELASKSVHQKGEVISMDIVRSSGIPVVQIEGQAIASGVFKGLPIVEGRKYDLFFSLVANPSLSNAGLYPYLVGDFKIDWKDI